MMRQDLWKYKDVVEPYVNEASGGLSCFSFIQIFAWQDFFRFEFKVINDHLCVFAANEMGSFLYWPPLGRSPLDLGTVDECFRWMERTNGNGGVTRIENIGQHHLDVFPEEQYHRQKKGYDYCYYREDITKMRGNAYKSKRSQCNQLFRQGHVDYHPFQDDMLEECCALYKSWSEDRRANSSDDIYISMLEENATVHRLVLQHYQRLNLTGRVVTVDGAVKAYTFGYPINAHVFCVLFEVADLSVKGLPSYIFREFCRDEAVRSYAFINTMDDFGMNTITETKLSFRPSVLLPMYTVTKKEKVGL